MLFLQIIRQFFYSIDSVLYNFIPVMYDLIILISRTTILSQGQIKEFADRVQLLLGVFMLFKVSFSLITYIINPDDFSDKGKGLGKLWLNIIISLILIVTTPYIFSLAYDFQANVLEDSTLADLIMGGNDNKVNYIYNAGNKIAFKTMLPFFTPNVAIESLNSCSNLIGVNGKVTDNCFDDLITIAGSDNETMINNYKSGIDLESFGLMFRVDISKFTVKPDDKTEYFLIDYKLGISTVAAVIVLLILTTFCMDVALRSVKLAFLQLISPIPIISYIDPKSGKDGLFKKWYEMCFKTYLSLFIRLISLYFGIYIISATTGMYDTITGARVNNFIVQLFIIIGVLMFVKQLPKILEGFGFKLDGDGKFNLNPLKKFEEQAAGGKQILGAAKGLATGATAGLLAAGSNAIAPGKGGRFFGGIAGFTSAFSKGVVGGLKGEKMGKNFSNSYSAAMKNKQSRSDRIDDNVSWREMMTSKIQQTMGMHSTADITKAASKHIKNINEAYSTMQSQAEAMDKYNFNVGGAAGVMEAYSGTNSKIQAFRAQSFAGIKALKKFQEQATAEKLEKMVGESDAAFITRQKEHQDYLKYIGDTIDTRLNDLARGVDRNGHVTTTRDPATDRAIHDAYRTMNDERNAFNSMIDSIDPNVGTISGTSPKEINGSSQGASARLNMSEVTQHAEKVQQYGSKKEQK